MRLPKFLQFQEGRLDKGGLSKGLTAYIIYNLFKKIIDKIIAIKDGDKKIAIIEMNALFILHNVNKNFIN